MEAISLIIFFFICLIIYISLQPETIKNDKSFFVNNNKKKDYNTPEIDKEI